MQKILKQIGLKRAMNSLRVIFIALFILGIQGCSLDVARENSKADLSSSLDAQKNAAPKTELAVEPQIEVEKSNAVESETVEISESSSTPTPTEVAQPSVWDQGVSRRVDHLGEVSSKSLKPSEEARVAQTVSESKWIEIPVSPESSYPLLYSADLNSVDPENRRPFFVLPKLELAQGDQGVVAPVVRSDGAGQVVLAFKVQLSKNGIAESERSKLELRALRWSSEQNQSGDRGNESGKVGQITIETLPVCAESLQVKIYEKQYLLKIVSNLPLGLTEKVASGSSLCELGRPLDVELTLSRDEFKKITFPGYESASHQPEEMAKAFQLFASVHPKFALVTEVTEFALDRVSLVDRMLRKLGSAFRCSLPECVRESQSLISEVLTQEFGVPPTVGELQRLGSLLETQIFRADDGAIESFVVNSTIEASVFTFSLNREKFFSAKYEIKLAASEIAQRQLTTSSHAIKRDPMKIIENGLISGIFAIDLNELAIQSLRDVIVHEGSRRSNVVCVRFGMEPTEPVCRVHCFGAGMEHTCEDVCNHPAPHQVCRETQDQWTQEVEFNSNGTQWAVVDPGSAEGQSVVNLIEFTVRSEKQSNRCSLKDVLTARAGSRLWLDFSGCVSGSHIDVEMSVPYTRTLSEMTGSGTRNWNGQFNDRRSISQTTTGQQLIFDVKSPAWFW